MVNGAYCFFQEVSELLSLFIGPLRGASMSSRRLAFVLPRYFKGIAGGAETLMGSLAQRLRDRGDYVEIWTTCAEDNRTWKNEFAKGATTIDGVTIHRFLVDERDLDVWIPLQISLHEGHVLSLEDQITWMSESVNSKALYGHISAHSRDFDALFFGPYLFGTTFWGSLIDPGRSVLIPCLHDEVYAYQEVVASMFRQVKGCLFNSQPEMDLAQSIYGAIPGGVVGMGFDLSSATRSGAEAYFSDPSPYILYLGRKETGKNVHVLVDYFVEAKERGLIPDAVKLVVLGGGSFSDLHRGEVLTRGDVIDLPHVSEGDKLRLLSQALCLCQPSTNESFSIVLMEAWMAGVPVVVHGGCAVTKHHVVDSGGGLYFSSSDDLAAVTGYFLDNPDDRRSHAEQGARYVRDHYSWEAVLGRFDNVVSAILGDSEAKLNGS